MNKMGGLVAGLFLALSAVAIADDSQPPVPPYVASLADFAAWSISVKPKGSKEAKPDTASSPTNAHSTRTVVKVVYVRTKGITRNVISYDNGVSSEVWYDNNLVIIGNARGEFEVFPSADAALMIPDMCDRELFGVKWVTATAYVGREHQADGTSVFVYRAKTSLPKISAPGGSPPIGAAAPTEYLPVEAKIDVTTQLPVELTRGDLTYAYSFQPPPIAMLELPPSVSKELARLHQQSDFLDRLRSLGRP